MADATAADPVTLQFTATIEITGINPYVLVTKDQATTLKPRWKKPMPLLVQVNGKPDQPWRINMMPMGNGDFYLYLASEVRTASHTKVGDVVEVTVSFDDDYKNGPMHPMPDWFREPLQANAAALEGWNALIPSRQKEILRYFAWLKSDAARARNVEKVLHVLSGREGRFMARSWKDSK